MSSLSSTPAAPATHSAIQETAPPNQFRGGSPTPSCSNSDLSLTTSIVKRKPLIDGLNPKPAKIFKPTGHPLPSSSNQPAPSHNLDNLNFDPFNPHPGMSKDERKLARMIRNRTAAQASRDRKKEHVAELESRVRELEEQVRILSKPKAEVPSMPCLRPCCLQATRESTDKKTPGPSTATRSLTPTQTEPVWSSRTISPDSIDPSIIQFKPSSSSSPEPHRSESKASPRRDQDNSSITVDPQLKSEGPSDGQQSMTDSTISPTQAEYLSRVRIHVLEEENIQLKSQLEYELKKTHQFKCRLLKSRLGQPVGLHQPQLPAMDEFEIDEGLIEMMLKDEEIENLLLTSTTTVASPPPPTTLLPPSNSQQDNNSSSYSSHPDELTQLSLDWESLLLDHREPDKTSSSSSTDDHLNFSIMDIDQFTSTGSSKESQNVLEDWWLRPWIGL
ncbi:hypothetical protein MJO28_015075 [Puccinia striiformis f. sp. tritici]|uniref:BZIP domain-containing protein n=3 Tax=Puccinia striiformis TaxID=27350 RepID=A0A0L0VGZ8_9BASI|nr:hypothetical protein Pst134EB_028452 [Puccinia striiformis f. sp. tritici]KAI9616124.1 hypothetical protein KEM48_005381 [Puccinia striiformis f. sp. tritici PST-130]KNE98561.1 hypothetical protein PSTG_08115 [Puccinia striiformis f. sp. tritici PST-78]POW21997.1 hypothetical protein PSHT_01742 [Puccinia striiformis]KAI7937524.1 hypothetical protein MJO29_014839 [Puccinia striiformis f. sp. tritici]